MKCFVNWIPLRICVRSRNTQPYRKELDFENFTSASAMNAPFRDYKKFSKVSSLLNFLKNRAIEREKRAIELTFENVYQRLDDERAHSWLFGCATALATPKPLPILN